MGVWEVDCAQRISDYITVILAKLMRSGPKVITQKNPTLHKNGPVLAFILHSVIS